MCCVISRLLWISQTTPQRCVRSSLKKPVSLGVRCPPQSTSSWTVLDNRLLKRRRPSVDQRLHLARACSVAGVSTVEIQGGMVTNDRLRRTLLRRGFEEAEILNPFFGETQDVLRRIEEVG